MQATAIGLDMVRKVAVQSGAVRPDNRLITEPVENIVDVNAVIIALYNLMIDYEAQL